MTEMIAAFSLPTKILLPTDFSSSSRTAVNTAIDLARHYKAQLQLVHIIPTTPDFHGADFFPEASVLEERRTGVKQRLNASRSTIVESGVDGSFSIETGNDIAGIIMKVIERDGIDIAVISTHGMSGWRPMVFGSIAEKVITLVQCPLLLLRPPKGAAVRENPALKLGKIHSAHHDAERKVSV